MQVKNQIVVISGIIALLATATIAASYTVQPVKAQGKSDSAYGQSVIKPNAHCQTSDPCQTAGNSGQATWGGSVSSAAQDDSSFSTHQGLGDWRANGCKTNEPRGTSNAGLC